MKCELRITSGARAGHREVLDKSYVGIGRHPLSDLRFDAEKDLDASTRHAAIVKSGTAWVLRDLGSTNGTFVNGEKLSGDKPLNDGDVLRFGVHGPEVSFHVVHEDLEAEIVMAAVHAPKSATRSEGAPAPKPAVPHDGVTPASPMKPPARTLNAPPPPSKTSVLRAEISHQQQRSRWLFVALLVLIAGALGVVYWQGRQSGAVISTQGHTLDSLRGVLAVLERAKLRADSEKTQLVAQLGAEHDPARRTVLTQQIRQMEQRSAGITQAQGVDYNAIIGANNAAVAQISVRCAADTTKYWSGTAFAVNTTGLLLTNRHVVKCEDGSAPSDIAVQFSGSSDVLPSRLVRVLPDADIASIQIEAQGTWHPVAGMADALPAVGAPIALLGFPGGGSRATLVTGSLTQVMPDSQIEVDAFSGVGASGSPIFDRTGKVIGIEFGGLVGSGGRAIVGLPIARAMSLIR
jgi:S1-C subfamily serine protease